MTAFPAAGAYTENGITQGTKRQRMDDQLEATLQMIGAGAVQSLTIASGSITPAAGASGSIKVDTEGASATDRLSNISTANLPDGSHILLRIADNGRVVTVGDTDGGAGQIATFDGLDYEMNRVGQWLELRREGSDWTEVRRGGREKIHTIGAGGEPAFQNSWADGGRDPHFWKDANGIVHCSGLAQKTSVAVASSLIFTLPAGYRPTGGTIWKPVYCVVGAGVEILNVAIQTTGDVTWQRAAGAPATVTVQVDLNGVDFRAEA